MLKNKLESSSKLKRSLALVKRESLFSFRGAQGHESSISSKDAKDLCDHFAHIGDVMLLMAHSPDHCRWTINEVLQWLRPPLSHRQYRLYYREGKLIAYVSWAFLTKELEEAYVANRRSLLPGDWIGGDRTWIIDLISPFCDSAYVMNDICEGLFRNEVGRMLKRINDSNERQIMYFCGVNAVDVANIEHLYPKVDVASVKAKAESTLSFDALLR
jgi:cytolysin-activating lysine-acyltransferase